MLHRIALVVLLLAAVSCDHGHEHDEGHGHSHDEHGHGDEHAGHAHDAHDDGHRVTAFGEKVQVYAEFRTLRAGQKLELLLHVTQLRGWLAVSDGTVVAEVEFAGQTARSEAVSAVRPGIFEPSVTVPAGADGKGLLRVTLDHPRMKESVTAELALGSKKSDDATHSHEEPITFLLEQQWSIPFGMAPARKQRVRDTFEAYGAVRPAIGGEGVVHAPVGGRVVGEDLPILGATVEQGQELAWLVPALADQGDLAGLDLALSSAEVSLRAARTERERLEGLLRDGVVAERRVVDARFAEEQARASLNAARRRMGQARGASGNRTRRGQGSIELRAPVGGVVVSVDVPPGLYVQAGHPLFRIVQPDPLWLEVAIPEVHVPRLSGATGVWFEVDGFDEPFEVVGSRLSIGGAVDTETRTLPLIVEVPNPDNKLRPGMFANVRVISGEREESLAVPRDAIVREDGLDVVFVATDGETFERRSLRLGARDGALVEVQSGLSEGEWVVTEGAFAVRLAGLGDQSGGGHGHGHAH